MNIQAQMQREHVRDMATLVALSAQPQVEVTKRQYLLAEKYDLDGVIVDLYGECEKFDNTYDVTDVALAGTSVSLLGILRQPVIDALNIWCDSHLGEEQESISSMRAGFRRELAAEVSA